MESLLDQVAEHFHKTWMGTSGCCTYKGQPQTLSTLLGLVVEIVKHFHVIGYKADRDHDYGFTAMFGETLKLVVDIGLQPRHAGRAATTLIGIVPAVVWKRQRHES